MDVDHVFQEIENSDRTTETITAILEGRKVDELRKMANEIVLGESAWRNRQATKTALIEGLAHELSEDSKNTAAVSHAAAPEDEDGDSAIVTEGAAGEARDREDSQDHEEGEPAPEETGEPEAGDLEDNEDHGDSGEPDRDLDATDDPDPWSGESEDDPDPWGEGESPEAGDEAGGEDQPEDSEEDPDPFEIDGGEGADREEIPEEAPESPVDDETPPEATEPFENPRSGQEDDLAEVIARAISDHLPEKAGTLDEDRVRAIATEVVDETSSDIAKQLETTANDVAANVRTMLEESAGHMAKQVREMLDNAKTTVKVEIPGRPTAEIQGHQHETFETLLNLLSAGLHVMLVGPAGSGKTTACDNVAKALSRRFYCISVGGQTPMSQLMGYMDAHGNYVRTVFRDAFEYGGVFLLDELDAGNPNVLTCLNAALANGVCAFPDGMIAQHPDFVCVAAANTYGTGHDRQYVGRNQLDATSLDRFATLPWDYDEVLERQLSGLDAWTDVVQAYRKACNELGVRHIISPRATIQGARLLLQGHFEVGDIVNRVVWKSLDRSSIAQIVEKAKKLGVVEGTFAKIQKEAEELRAALVPETDEWDREAEVA